MFEVFIKVKTVFFANLGNLHLYLLVFLGVKSVLESILNFLVLKLILHQVKSELL